MCGNVHVGLYGRSFQRGISKNMLMEGTMQYTIASKSKDLTQSKALLGVSSSNVVLHS